MTPVWRKWAAAGLAAALVGTKAEAFTVVDAGEARADIVIPAKPIYIERYAAEELQYHLEKATGVRLAIVTETNMASAVSAHFFVGATAAARAAGLTASPLAMDERILKSTADALFLLGGDTDMKPEDLYSMWTARACGTLYAVYDYLEAELDVKWLWPGELGEVIPRRTRIEIGSLDRRNREVLDCKWWSMQRVPKGVGFREARNRDRFFKEQGRFLLRHHVNRHYSFESGHAYGNYWQRFGKTHPEWFNLTPKGERGPLTWICSMCVSNPEFQQYRIDEAFQHYRRLPAPARATTHPPWFTICENDCAAMCTCENCRAWDGPDPRFAESGYWNGEYARLYRESGGKLDLQDIGHAEFGALADYRTCVQELHKSKRIVASVSDRYVKFYNVMQALAAARDPKARVLGYAYENYIEPPLATKIDPRVIVNFVPRSMFPYDQEESDFFRKCWLGWRRMGAETMMYRPNYTYAGGNSPIDFSRLATADFAFAFTNGMKMAQYDALVGAWASQTMQLYVLNRAMRDPLRGYAAAREDMTSAFGKAKPVIDRYFDAIEAHTYKWNYDSYREIGLKNKIGRWTGGSFTSAQAIYEEFISEAELKNYNALLDEARQVAAGDELVVRRIDFLRKGLKDTELTRNYRIAEKRGAGKAEAFKAMVDFRASVEADLVCNYAHVTLWERDCLKWPHPKDEKKEEKKQ